MKRALQTIALVLAVVPAAAGPLSGGPSATPGKTPFTSPAKTAAPNPSASKHPDPIPAKTPVFAVKSASVRGQAKTTKPRSDLANAQRAMDAAKQFLSKAPNDPAGHRLKAQQALETALTEVTAALGPHAAK